MDYRIRFVPQLPEGRDFMLAVLPDRVVILFRESALCPSVLEDAWAAFRALLDSPLAVAV